MTRWARQGMEGRARLLRAAWRTPAHPRRRMPHSRLLAALRRLPPARMPRLLWLGAASSCLVSPGTGRSFPYVSFPRFLASLFFLSFSGVEDRTSHSHVSGSMLLSFPSQVWKTTCRSCMCPTSMPPTQTRTWYCKRRRWAEAAVPEPAVADISLARACPRLHSTARAATRLPAAQRGCRRACFPG